MGRRSFCSPPTSNGHASFAVTSPFRKVVTRSFSGHCFVCVHSRFPSPALVLFSSLRGATVRHPTFAKTGNTSPDTAFSLVCLSALFASHRTNGLGHSLTNTKSREVALSPEPLFLGAKKTDCFRGVVVCCRDPPGDRIAFVLPIHRLI